jgi:hypothetical protein
MENAPSLVMVPISLQVADAPGLCIFAADHRRKIHARTCSIGVWPPWIFVRTKFLTIPVELCRRQVATVYLFEFLLVGIASWNVGLAPGASAAMHFVLSFLEEKGLQP